MAHLGQSPQHSQPEEYIYQQAQTLRIEHGSVAALLSTCH